MGIHVAVKVTLILTIIENYVGNSTEIVDANLKYEMRRKDVLLALFTHSILYSILQLLDLCNFSNLFAKIFCELRTNIRSSSFLQNKPNVSFVDSMAEREVGVVVPPSFFFGLLCSVLLEAIRIYVVTYREHKLPVAYKSESRSQ